MHLSQRAQSSPRGEGEWFLYQPLFKDLPLEIVEGRAPAGPVSPWVSIPGPGRHGGRPSRSGSTRSLTLSWRGGLPHALSHHGFPSRDQAVTEAGPPGSELLIWQADTRGDGGMKRSRRPLDCGEHRRSFPARSAVHAEACRVRQSSGVLGWGRGVSGRPRRGWDWRGSVRARKRRFSPQSKGGGQAAAKMPRQTRPRRLGGDTEPLGGRGRVGFGGVLCAPESGDANRPRRATPEALGLRRVSPLSIRRGAPCPRKLVERVSPLGLSMGMRSL